MTSVRFMGDDKVARGREGLELDPFGIDLDEIAALNVEIRSDIALPSCHSPNIVDREEW